MASSGSTKVTMLYSSKEEVAITGLLATTITTKKSIRIRKKVFAGKSREWITLEASRYSNPWLVAQGVDLARIW